MKISYVIYNRQLFSKGILYVILFGLSLNHVFGQIAINSTENTAHPKAALDITSTDKGILIPRMSASDRLSINSPAEGLLVYQVDGIKGFYLKAGSSWKSINRSSASLPIGSVIDWWRPNIDLLIPKGYKICDGTVITEVKSPLNGQMTPDMTDRFVVGTSNPAEAGELGGAATHTHDLSYTGNSSFAFNHNHTFNYGTIFTNNSGNLPHQLIPSSGNLSTSYGNGHRWANFNEDTKVWSTYNSAGVSIDMINWGNGMDSDGSGHYPIQSENLNFSSFNTANPGNVSHGHSYEIPAGKYTSADGGHRHEPYIGQKTTGNAGSHSHSFNSGTITSDESSNNPKNTGLLKLMRIY